MPNPEPGRTNPLVGERRRCLGRLGDLFDRYGVSRGVSTGDSASLDNSSATSAGGRSAGVAVGVARRVAALEAGLVHPQATENVVVREESAVGDKTSGGHVGVKFGHPCPDAVSRGWNGSLTSYCLSSPVPQHDTYSQ